MSAGIGATLAHAGTAEIGEADPPAYADVMGTTIWSSGWFCGSGSRAPLSLVAAVVIVLVIVMAVVVEVATLARFHVASEIGGGGPVRVEHAGQE